MIDCADLQPFSELPTSSRTAAGAGPGASGGMGMQAAKHEQQSQGQCEPACALEHRLLLRVRQPRSEAHFSRSIAVTPGTPPATNIATPVFQGFIRL